MRTNPNTGTTSFASIFLVILMVSGVLDVDLLYRRAVGHGDGNGNILYRIEILLTSRHTDVSLSIFKVARDTSGDKPTGDWPFDFVDSGFRSASFLSHRVGQIILRRPESGHTLAGYFNIPHQNSEEDEALRLAIDVV